MGEYTTPIYDLDANQQVGILTFDARDWDEADGIIDQWNIHHGLPRYRASSFSCGLTYKPVQTPGNIRAEYTRV